MTGTKKKKNRGYHPNWGGRRPGQGRKPWLPEDQRNKHTKSFWVTDAEAEALKQYLDELRNGKAVEK